MPEHNVKEEEERFSSVEHDLQPVAFLNLRAGDNPNVTQTLLSAGSTSAVTGATEHYAFTILRLDLSDSFTNEWHNVSLQLAATTFLHELPEIMDKQFLRNELASEQDVGDVLLVNVMWPVYELLNIVLYCTGSDWRVQLKSQTSGGPARREARADHLLVAVRKGKRYQPTLRFGEWLPTNSELTVPAWISAKAPRLTYVGSKGDQRVLVIVEDKRPYLLPRSKLFTIGEMSEQQINLGQSTGELRGALSQALKYNHAFACRRSVLYDSVTSYAMELNKIVSPKEVPKKESEKETAIDVATKIGKGQGAVQRNVVQPTSSRVQEAPPTQEPDISGYHKVFSSAALRGPLFAMAWRGLQELGCFQDEPKAKEQRKPTDIDEVSAALQRAKLRSATQAGTGSGASTSHYR